MIFQIQQFLIILFLTRNVRISLNIIKLYEFQSIKLFSATICQIMLGLHKISVKKHVRMA